MNAAEALREAVGAPAAGVIGWAFRCMDVAEDVIADAIRRHPEAADALGRTFLAMCPRHDVFGDKDPELVRAHMEELVRRVVAGGESADLVHGTAAEACVALAALSGAAPLRHDYMVVYQMAFVDVFGEDRARAVLGDEPVRRTAVDREDPRMTDLYAEVRHHMRDTGRRLGEVP